MNYAPGYFGDSREDCLCPHTEFHGNGTLVLRSRTRSQAHIAGEKGTLLEHGHSKRKPKKSAPSTGARSNVVTTA